MASRLLDSDRATITPIVRRALRSASIEIDTWSSTQLYGGAWGSGLHRLAGSALDQGRAVEWSVIVKVVVPPERGSDTTHWTAELGAYRSGFLDDLPAGLSVPRCFGLTERPSGEVWLWLEDVRDDLGPKWPITRYGLAARHLGQFGAAFVAKRSVPSYPWLGTGVLRSWVESVGPALTQIRGLEPTSFLRQRWPDEVIDRAFALWERREDLLGALDRLPQTVCHHDAFRRNLFARRLPDGSEETVVIDWAFAGIGALGEDSPNLVWSSVKFFEAELSELRELEDSVVEGYIAGARDAGWIGDSRLIRFAYAATTALRYGFELPQLPLQAGHAAQGSGTDEASIAHLERVIGHPVGEIAERMWQARELALDRADEAFLLRPLVQLVA